MGPKQANAIDFNPNNLAFTEVATYQRLIHANIDRVWENVLDWEHLPWLHKTSFNYVEVEDAQDWGWRTWSRQDKSAHVELVVDKSNQQYVARTYTQNQQISEIWTRLDPQGTDTGIKVSFNVVDLDAALIEKVSKVYLNLYEKLWDEDETMMSERHRQLTDKSRGPDEVDLGKRDDLGSQLPLKVKLGRTTWLIRENAGELLVHSATCPHLLGPLDQGEIDKGTVKCPWHGYKFDLKSGACIDPAHGDCRLPQPPRIIENPDTTNIILKI